MEVSNKLSLLPGGYTTTAERTLGNQWSAAKVPTQNLFEHSGDKEKRACFCWKYYVGHSERRHSLTD
jgi:hypothetical protein